MLYRIRERIALNESNIYQSEYRPWYKWKWKKIARSTNLNTVKQGIREHKSIKVRTIKYVL